MEEIQAWTWELAEEVFCLHFIAHDFSLLYITMLNISSSIHFELYQEVLTIVVYILTYSLENKENKSQLYLSIHSTTIFLLTILINFMFLILLVFFKNFIHHNLNMYILFLSDLRPPSLPLKSNLCWQQLLDVLPSTRIWLPYQRTHFKENRLFPFQQLSIAKKSLSN